MGESAETVQAYVARQAMTFPILLDEQHTLASMFAVRATPTNYLVNRHGCIVAGGPGYRDWSTEAAHRLIAGLLSETRPRPC